MIPGFLTSRLAGPIGAGLSLLLAIALAWVWIGKDATLREVRGQLTAAQSDLKAARDDLTQCRANRITLEDATRRQNEAVAKATGEMAARLKGLEGVVDRAAANAARASSSAERILSTGGTGDVCRDADALILGEVK